MISLTVAQFGWMIGLIGGFGGILLTILLQMWIEEGTKLK